MKVDLKKWMKEATDATPVGMIVSFAGSTAPTGWLLCQGQAVSRTTYAKLFSVIGTTYGSGNGSTTFNVPDMRGRSPLGVGNGDATGHTNHTLGQKGGEETHKLQVSEMPQHRHGINYVGTSGSGYGYQDTGSGRSSGYQYTTNEGGNGSHNTLHPYLGLNFIIYVGGGST